MNDHREDDEHNGCGGPCDISSDTGVVHGPAGVTIRQDNPFRKLGEVIEPAPPHTVSGHVEWLSLRTASLHRWVAAGEKDLLLETLRRMEDNIRAIRSLLNKDAESAAESELKFQETLRNATRVANKTERKDRNRVFWLRGAKW